MFNNSNHGATHASAKLNRYCLLLAAVSCVLFLSVALYLQLVKQMYPCPLCIIARYVYIAVFLVCLVTALWPAKITAQRLGAGLAGLIALGGVGLGLYHQWVLAHPAESCGIDPTKTLLNQIFTAQWLPNVFYASGMCSDVYPPFLGIQIPMWSLLCCMALTTGLFWVAFRSNSK